MNRLLIPAVLLSAAAAFAQSIVYEVPAKPWEVSLGSHRAVVRVEQPAEAARVRVEWRRRDPQPEKKAVVVVDAQTGKRIANALATGITAESGDVAFQPVSGAGEYFVYFLPGDPGSGSFPRAKYLPPQEASWKPGTSVEAKVVRWDARTAHDRFTEMEIIATASERDAWRAQHPEVIAAFVEPASRVVRMFDHVPQRWLLPHAAEEPEAGAGEPLVFQIGVWAARGELRTVRLRFSDLQPEGAGPAIPGAQIRCFQIGGTDVMGLPFERRVDIPAGGVLPLWCGLKASVAEPGRYVGMVEISADGIPAQRMPFAIKVNGKGDLERAFAEPERLAKLFWLDSTIAQEDVPTRGFVPVAVEGRTIHVLGRAVTLGETGLPERITSYFHPGVTRIVWLFSMVLGHSALSSLASSCIRICRPCCVVTWQRLNTSAACRARSCTTG